MKTSIDAAFITALLSNQARPAVFVECLFTTYVRRTTLDIDYYYNGVKYDSDGVKVDRMINGRDLSVDRATVTLANTDRMLSAILLANNERGKTVNIYLAGIDDDGTLIGSGHAFRGMLSTYTIRDDVVELNLVTEMIMWKKRSARRAGALCPWPFKGTECGYSGGESWCDQTYDRCSTLVNTANFGGNRFLPALQEKKIYWGRVQK